MYSEYLSKSNQEKTQTQITFKPKKANFNMGGHVSVAKGMGSSDTGNKFYNSNSVLQMHKNKVIQMYRFGSNADGFSFSAESIKPIQTAVEIAETRLGNALQSIQRSRTDPNVKKCLMSAIEEILEVLKGRACFCPTSQISQDVYGEIDIFTFENSDTKKIEFAPNGDNIYINMSKNQSQPTLIKTIIHEAFHLVGGDMIDMNEKSCGIATKEFVLPLISKTDRRAISADAFAQYVMLCN
ncbi:MAG: hypothetical protein J1F03_03475 [Oscillospiraceae bacterium]|nr:hypothetical protein [Oscillospiraceae bacterium]